MTFPTWWLRYMQAQADRIQPTLVGRVQADLDNYLLHTRYALIILCSLCESPIDMEQTRSLCLGNRRRYLPHRRPERVRGNTAYEGRSLALHSGGTHPCDFTTG